MNESTMTQPTADEIYKKLIELRETLQVVEGLAWQVETLLVRKLGSGGEDVMNPEIDTVEQRIDAISLALYFDNIDSEHAKIQIMDLMHCTEEQAMGILREKFAALNKKHGVVEPQ